MKRAILFTLLALGCSTMGLFGQGSSSSSQSPLDRQLGGINLLDGYTVRRDPAVDATAWTIEKKGGAVIEFEAGPSEGPWADPKNVRQYEWYREQRLHGYRVRFALVKAGEKTVWEPQNTSAQSIGNILLVTFLLDSVHPDHTANFKAKIKQSSDLADALLMVQSFDPSKGSF